MVGGQAIPDGGIDLRGVPQGEQQLFLKIETKGLGGLHAVLELEMPIVLQTQLKRRIMLGGNEKV